MYFRMKRTHYTGLSRSGIFKGDVPPLIGCRHYNERLELYQGGDSVTPQRRQEIMSLLRQSKNNNAPPDITITLKHGDMLIMHGADIQRCYEVSRNGSRGVAY